MPIITAEGPKINDLEKRKEFVKTVTEAASKYFNLPEESIIILIKENSPENVSVGGKLISEKNKDSK
ncbi:tautomerase family protein [Deferribacter thermophilus]|uniref:4-oxalocrotonate tautomerase DmpI n=1 Tax=Deferribacter thermophilus TaxID=53573 RepID=UPI003C1AF2B8